VDIKDIYVRGGGKVDTDEIKTPADYEIYLLTKAQEKGYPYFEEILSNERKKIEAKLKTDGLDEYAIEIALRDYQEMLNILYAAIVNKEIEEAIFMWERMETDLRKKLLNVLVH
jgi:ATP-dependent protease HslVU (ClpYQ) ATPase subunit